MMSYNNAAIAVYLAFLLLLTDRFSFAQNVNPSEISASHSVSGYPAYRYLATPKDSAIFSLKKALQVADPSAHKDSMISQYIALARLYGEVGEYQDALATCHHLLAQLESGYYDKLRSHYAGKIYNILGRCFFLSANYDSSLFYYNRTVAGSKSSETMDYRDAVLANTAMGMIHSRMRDSFKSIHYFTEAYNLSIRHDDTNMQMACLLNLGNFYQSQENHLRAKHIYYQVLYTEFSGKEKHLPNLYSMLALALWNTAPDSLERILYFAGEGYKYALKADNNNSIVQTQYILGFAYLKNNQLNAARQHLIQGLQLAEEKGVDDNKQTAYLYLGELYASLNDFRKAYEFQQKYYEIRDSLSGLETVERVAHIEQQYKAAETALKVTRQTKKLLQKNIWIGGITAGAAGLTLFFIILLINIRRRQQLAAQQQEMSQLKAIMKGEEQERSRLARELHDGIGGMIAVIKMNVGSAIKENPEASQKVDLPLIDKLLENTSDEVRKTASNLMPDVLAKYGLEEALTLYCNQINNGGTLFIDLQFHADLSFLDKATQLIFYRIIQELIQNTIKHARATKAELQVIRHEDTLHLSLEDDGSGFDPAVHSSGFGLGNLRFRVQSLHGKLEIISSPAHPTTVHIEFDIPKIIKYSNNG